MGMRARNIQPGFYRNAQLAACSLLARLTYPGLWMLADRLGRLIDDPAQIAFELLPREAGLDMDAVLWELAEAGFVVRYEAAGDAVLAVLEFGAHQRPHPHERTSQLPGPDDFGVTVRTRRACSAGLVSEPEPLAVAHQAAAPAANDEPAGSDAATAPDGGPVGAVDATGDEVPALAQGPSQAELPGFGLVMLTRTLDPEATGSGGRPRRQPRDAPPDCPHGIIAALWRHMLPGLPPPAEPWVGAARVHLRARWRETAKHEHWTSDGQGIEHFRELFAYVRRSNFLMGRTGPRRQHAQPFEVTLEWLVKLEHWQRVRQGMYHDKEARR